MRHENYYIKNDKYSRFLEGQERETFKKYSGTLVRYSKKNSKLLDVGCGTGIALEQVRDAGGRVGYGIEISRESVKIAKKKKVLCRQYDGEHIPFADKFFTVVGSMNVLEHTDDPVNFLQEQLRVVKPGGYLIISCPNFLSVTNGYHYHTRGIRQKMSNFFSILSRMIVPRTQFEKMKTVEREAFEPDDDACNVTNPLDILAWAKENKLTLIEWSSQQNNVTGIKNLLDHGIMKIFLGSSFFVFRKPL